jgi:hypothetical protein
VLGLRVPGDFLFELTDLGPVDAKLRFEDLVDGRADFIPQGCVLCLEIEQRDGNGFTHAIPSGRSGTADVSGPGYPAGIYEPTFIRQDPAADINSTEIRHPE